jgi:putative ABC transport system permease protein
MKWLFSRLRKQEEDLEEELKAHLAIEASERREAGTDPQTAAREAARVFGNVTRTKEETRETWGWPVFERFVEDLRQGLRMLRKSPVWTLVVGATLALGIGLTTAIFSVAYGILWRPLPYPDADRIVTIFPTAGPPGVDNRYYASAALWLEWSRQSGLLEQIALTRPVANFNLTGEGHPERLQGARIAYNVPAILGMSPQSGRLFTEAEQRADAKVALLSHRLWTRRFGGDSSIVGRKIQLNGEPFEVIGVMPPQYTYPNSSFDLWTPLFLPPGDFRHGWNYQYLAIGKMRPGTSVAQVQAEFSAIARRLAAQFAEYRGRGASTDAIVQLLPDSDAARVRASLHVLLGASGCVLLIGCMNLAVLLIAKTSARASEFELRTALGASAGRIWRQLLAEVLPLGLAGCIGGLLLAWAFLRLVLPWMPSSMPRVDSLGLHSPAVMFSVLTSLAVVLCAGSFPVRGLLGHRGSRSFTSGLRVQHRLIVAQLAVATLLLCCGSLLARSFSELLKVDPGFRAEGTLSMHLAVARTKYRSDDQVAAYYQRLENAIASLPGVTAAGFVNRLPLSGVAQTGGVEFEGHEGRHDSDWRSATPGYFAATGIPLKRGRVFSYSDKAPVGLIDESMARRVFGDKSPLGKRFRRALPPEEQQEPWAEIVGVVGHVRNDSLERDDRPQVYWPETQRAQDRAALVVRVIGKPETYVSSIVGQVRAENPDQPVYDVRTMQDWIDRTTHQRMLTTSVVGIFAAASLVLALLGLYGVVSYAAALRSREFGIRLALGAVASQLAGLVIRHAAKLAVAGSSLGLALSVPATQVIRSQLFAVSVFDPLSWTVAPALLVGVAVIASLGPACRASRNDPVVTLRLD